jgi:hypothetical protein
MKKNSYSIIEDRGCGIEYEVFEGTGMECAGWLNRNTVVDDNGNNISIDEDGSVETNGNGDPFTYELKSI